MNKFIFVVCGAREHIESLNFSLQALKKQTDNEIIVLTDSKRNSLKIAHSNIIDIATPTHLNHHQASIFLKTSIHKYLPKGNSYCYLDTDVVALDKSVDAIFEQYQAPIT